MHCLKFSTKARLVCIGDGKYAIFGRKPQSLSLLEFSIDLSIVDHFCSHYIHVARVRCQHGDSQPI